MSANESLGGNQIITNSLSYFLGFIFEPLQGLLWVQRRNARISLWQNHTEWRYPRSSRDSRPDRERGRT